MGGTIEGNIEQLDYELMTIKGHVKNGKRLVVTKSSSVAQIHSFASCIRRAHEEFES